MIKDISTFFPYLWDTISGNYFRIPIFTIIGICVALLYFASPIDFIPDLILGIGFADDLLFLLLGGVAGGHLDLAKYRKWREQREQWLDDRMSEFNFGTGNIPQRRPGRKPPTSAQR